MPYHCLTDISGPFYHPEKPFRNWSALPFYQLDLDYFPYVDVHHLEWGCQRARAYLQQIHDQGYTGIVMDNLAHLVAFDHVPIPLYTANSPYLIRAKTYRSKFGELFDAATQLGMDVFVTTDMQWCTPPIKAFVGRLSAHNPRLAQVNRYALEEIFITMPQIRGIVVRVGEAGGAHNQGESYTGHMIYTTKRHLQQLIATLLPVCEAFDRLLIIRSWSIGIGELGDLMWSPERYHEVFGKYTSPHIFVSIKHGPSDFMRFLPHNPTLGLPAVQQIIEMQNRREYELFGMIPNSIGPLHQAVIQQALAKNHRFAGVWAWNSTGGWGGGRSVLGKDGWSVWTELSSALTATLLHQPESDVSSFVQCWCRNRFGETVGSLIANLYIESSKLIEDGWYMGTLPQGVQTMGSIYIPPLLWVWWMRPTASFVIWSYLASSIGESNALVQQSVEACQRIQWYVHALRTCDDADNPDVQTIIESTVYFQNIMEVALALRRFMLRAFDAAAQGNRMEWQKLHEHISELRSIIRNHQEQWLENRDFPALELDEIDTFLAVWQKKPSVIWLQARAAWFLVRQWRETPQMSQTAKRTMHIVAATLLLLSLFSKQHRNVGILGLFLSIVSVPPIRQRTLHAVLPWASRRFYLLPSIFFETGPSVKEWMA